MTQLTTLHTDGSGYWTTVAKAVGITKLVVPYIGEDEDFAELCVYFNTDDWDTRTQGLIYTDKLFLQQLRDYLNSLGLAGEDVEYSEQGMQDDDYVSCDVGAEFLKTWKVYHPEEYIDAMA